MSAHAYLAYERRSIRELGRFTDELSATLGSAGSDYACGTHPGTVWSAQNTCVVGSPGSDACLSAAAAGCVSDELYLTAVRCGQEASILPAINSWVLR